jgi:hypothetical protein
MIVIKDKLKHEYYIGDLYSEIASYLAMTRGEDRNDAWEYYTCGFIFIMTNFDVGVLLFLATVPIGTRTLVSG